MSCWPHDALAQLARDDATNHGGSVHDDELSRAVVAYFRSVGRPYPYRSLDAVAQAVGASGQLTALVKTLRRRMQSRPGLLDGFLAKTCLDLL